MRMGRLRELAESDFRREGDRRAFLRRLLKSMDIANADAMSARANYLRVWGRLCKGDPPPLLVGPRKAYIKCTMYNI